jgi:superoxide dismutase, Fe-Mn family
MPFTLPPLPYPANALEPHIDARTMEIHHGKHHQAYVTNLNTALEKAPDQQGQPIEKILSGLNAVPEAV